MQPSTQRRYVRNKTRSVVMLLALVLIAIVGIRFQWGKSQVTLPAEVEVGVVGMNALTPFENEALLETLEPTVAEIVRGYRDWERLNKTPFPVSEANSGSCAKFEVVANFLTGQPSLVQPSPPETATFDEHGIHFVPFINVYANRIAAEAIRARSFPLPIGSVVVKEKVHNDPPSPMYNDARSDEEFELTGLGVMVKQQNLVSEYGGWQYHFAGRKHEDERFALAYNCAGCHMAKQETDHLFLNYQALATND